ncbi:ATP-binding protein [Nonomuraea typhae]|uniref:ATP-binding protein n=1 Tax=Nonomuraea typhae TaxID=2603600 RepID=A0ABW7YS20_9ACTN
MEIVLPLPVAHSRNWPGEPQSLGECRAWVRRVLPEGCPRAADVLQVVGELAANAVMHSTSGAPGGRYAVQVEVGPESVGVTVMDLGPVLVKAVRPLGEGGHGLAIVRELADGYDAVEWPCGRIVTCWLDYPTTTSCTSSDVTSPT